jgi:SdrD B-like domain
MNTKLKTKWGLTLVLSVLVLFSLSSCNLMSTDSDAVLETADLDIPVELAKGGETGYAGSNGGSGEFVGYTESDNPDYGVFEYTLWAGKHNDAGSVTITNDDDMLYININTNETADLEEAHVYIWNDLSDIPGKRPAPGKAPYKAENIHADEYTFEIPMTLLCGEELYISVHTALESDASGNGEEDNSGETAYAGANDVFPDGKGAWWGYVSYTVDCFFDISGTVYDDANNNFDLDGELGFEGYTVQLFDVVGDSVLAETVTAADGSYLFEHVLGGGDYSVLVTDGPAGYDATENANGFEIVGLDESLTDIDFGFYLEIVEPEVPEEEPEEEPEGPAGSEETAWAGNIEGAGNAWWFYFDTQSSATQSIYAGQNLVEGASVTYEQRIDGNYFVIVYGPNMGMQDVSETVKIEGYDVIPTVRPAAGQFTYKSDGSPLEIFVGTVDYRYYAFHLDVVVRN